MAEIDKQSSPEKQLLKIIEEPESLKKHSAGRRRIFGKLSLGFLKGKFSFFFKTNRLQVAANKPFSIRALNLGLIVLVGICLAVFVLNFILKKNYYDNQERLEVTFTEKERPFVSTESNLEPLATYEILVQQKDIFRPSGTVKKEEKKEEEQKKEEEIPKEPTINDLISDYSLVGIAWSSSPDAMIEDAKDKATYFFKEGQALKSGVKIKKIEPTKVILQYKDQEAILE